MWTAAVMLPTRTIKAGTHSEVSSPVIAAIMRSPSPVMP
jgi:hypothetical protein